MKENFTKEYTERASVVERNYCNNATKYAKIYFERRRKTKK